MMMDGEPWGMGELDGSGELKTQRPMDHNPTLNTHELNSLSNFRVDAIIITLKNVTGRVH